MRNHYLKIFLYSVILNALVMLGYLLICSFKIEIEDNLGYAQFIAEGDYTFGFMDFFVCAGIGLLQKIIYPINAFVVVHFALSFFSFCAITIVFVDKFKYIIGTMMSLIILSFYAISHYGNLSFTRDAALFCVAGFLFILHFHKKKKFLIFTIAGGLLVFAGSQYRFMVFLVSAFMLAIYVLIDSFLVGITSNLKERFVQGVKYLFERKRLISFLVVVCFCLAMHFVSVGINTSTPELAYYHEYTYARQYVYDYPIPDYSECSKEYDKIGFDQNDIEMNRAWYLDDGGAFTLDNLRELKQIRDSYSARNKNYGQLLLKIFSEEFGSIRALGDKGVALIGYAFIALLFLILMKKRYYLMPVGLSLVVFFFYFYLWNTDRNPPYRGVYMLWISACIYLLYSIDVSRIKTVWNRCVGKKIGMGFLIIGMLAMSIIGFRISALANNGIINYDKNDYSYLKIQTDTSGGRQVFSFSNTYYKYTNIMRHMAEFGTDNMYSNLLNENVYFVCDAKNDDSEMLRKYLSKYYGQGKTIQCQKIVTLDGYTSLESYMEQDDSKKFELSRKTPKEFENTCMIYKYEII